MRWSRGSPRIDLDQPVPGMEVGNSLRLVGWAFSRGAPVARVEAALGSDPPVALQHGVARPDVAAIHGCDAACGFEGVLALDGARPGPVTLRVTAIDARGRRAERSLMVTCRGRGAQLEPLLEIEEARWRGAELELLGYAIAAPGTSWLSLRVELDGVPTARVRHGLSRPELAERFLDRPEARRAGFQFRGELAAEGRLELCAEALDGGRLRRLLPRPARIGRTDASGELARLMLRLRGELERDPALLDATGLGLASQLPGELTVTPLDVAVLPYEEGSFDVVVIAGGDAARLALARRFATRAVVRVDRSGQPEIIQVHAGTANGAPRVSVVIPVFNQSACTDACLNAVLETWPPSLEGEVLVVDDGSSDDTGELLARWPQRDGRVRSLRLPDNRGFIAACNAGAAAATGDVLVFLNNDTLPRPGWLPPLVATLKRARAGAVGGKLLNTDGTLQEAGGVVFADGDGWNFGKGDPAPDHPLFDHVREVDYCSGALLATPRSLFLAMGGFAAAYAPAYYEDTDYAFRLRRDGYRVYYQPASVVVHLEGATAGRDVTQGVKRHQASNRETFVARWADALQDQPSHPPVLDRAALHSSHVRRRDARRALVILQTMPELDRESGSRRAFHLIELLVELSWCVSVVVENATGGERYARRLRQLGVATYAGPDTSGAGADYLPRLSELITAERFDLALPIFWPVAERHIPTLRALSPWTRVIVDSVDLHFLREARGAFARGGSDGRGPLDSRFAEDLRRELNAYGAADAVLTVSDKEAAWIDDLVGSAGHGRCVPDLEDPAGASRARELRRGLLFLGNFRHPPNLEALALLADVVDRVDPALLAEHPLAIVGNALESHMLGRLARNPYVRAVGFVPAVEPYLQGALVSLVPLRHGAGTKRKLLQSLLAGTPCVSTSVGIEGLGLERERHVLVADGAEALAAGLSRLVMDAETWQRLSREGRAAVERSHGRDRVRALFSGALDATLRV